MTSGLIDTLSSSTGCGGTSNVYDMRVGWIMMRELLTSSSFSTCLQRSSQHRPRKLNDAEAYR